MIKPTVPTSDYRSSNFIRSNTVGGTLTIQVGGRFDFNCHREFRSSYGHPGPIDEYVVDLGSTEYLDSSALGMLLVLREEGQHARIRIVNSRPAVRRILEIANFNTLFTIE